MALALSCVVFAVAACVGFAVGGVTGSARAVLLAFGAAMLGFSGVILWAAIRNVHADEDWAVVGVLVALRTGAGVAAIWLAVGGGKAAGWTMVGFIVAYPIWMEVMRRRRGVA